MIQQLGGDRVSTQQARRDRESDGHFQMGSVIADPQISRRTLVEFVDDLAQLAAAELCALPSLKRLGNGDECPPQLLFVRDRRVLTEEAFDSLWRLSHTSSLCLSNGRAQRRAKRARWSTLLGGQTDYARFASTSPQRS